jgi:hypothetical protein
VRPLALPLLIALSACAPDAAPPACVQMCAAAADLYGGCLEEWGVGWSDAGYAGRGDFLGACETWGWEMALLEQDAVQAGDADAEGALARTCGERRAAFLAEDATCETYTGIDWQATPWGL